MQLPIKHSPENFLYIAQPFKWNGQTYTAQRYVESSQKNFTPMLEIYFLSQLLEFCHHPPNIKAAYESVVRDAVAHFV
jgi:hypothetical protein